MKKQEQLKSIISAPLCEDKSINQQQPNFADLSATSSDDDTQITTKQKTGTKKKFKEKPIICNVSDTKYPVVRYVCRKMLKFKLQRVAEANNWDVMWTDNAVQPEQLSRMQHHQKINHFPGMYSLSRKNYLGRNLMRMRKRFPEDYKFFPLTWMLPSEFGDFRTYYEKYKKNKTYIVKPEASCQGRGIFLTKDIQDIQHGEHYVVQKYITKPFLLDQLKFDFRIYVLLAGCSPLRIYLYNQGLTRFATQKYTAPNKDNIDDVCMHLTNYAINKSNQNFVYNQSQKEMNTGHKRSLSAVMNLLTERGHNTKQLWNDIKDMIIKTFVSAQPVLSHHYKSCQPDNYANNMCFELLGFDIMLDHKFKPYVLQVNYTPSFTTDTPLDKLIKKNVIYDSLQIMNINNKSKNQVINSNKEILLKRVLSGKKARLTNQEKFEEIKKAQIKRDQWQNKHLGGFQKIYPAQNQKQYEQFLNYSLYCYQELTGANIRRNMKKEKSVQITETKKETTNEQLEKIYKAKLPLPKQIIRKPNLSTVKSIPGTQAELTQTKSRIDFTQTNKQTTKQIKFRAEMNHTKYNRDAVSQKQILNPKIAKEKEQGNYLRPKLFELNNIPKNSKQ